MDEVEAYLETLNKQLKGLIVTLKKIIFDVADLLKEKIKDHSALVELKVEECGKDLEYLVKQKFLEQDSRLKNIETTVQE
ncbi:hypothetical protein Dimus_016043, partial [Dionaea muscipula]